MADIEKDKAWMARRSAVAQANEILKLAQEPYSCGCKRGECTGHTFGPVPGVTFFDDFQQQP